jgi:hypothetical protein
LASDEWIKKAWCIYTREYYSALKMKEMSTFATIQMKLENTVLSEKARGRKTNPAWNLKP